MAADAYHRLRPGGFEAEREQDCNTKPMRFGHCFGTMVNGVRLNLAQRRLKGFGISVPPYYYGSKAGDDGIFKTHCGDQI